MMSREEIIENYKLELNPGSKKVDDLLNMMADLHIERDALMVKLEDAEKKNKELSESKSYWYDQYDLQLKKVEEIKKSLCAVKDVVIEIGKRWI